MRRYEQIYILRPSLTEEEITTVIENSNQIILDEGGAIIALNKWGMRKLAYPIKKEPQGYYVLADFAATPDAVAEIERKFRIDDAVLKYLTVRTSDAITAEEIAEAQNAAETAAAATETDVVEDNETAKDADVVKEAATKKDSETKKEAEVVEEAETKKDAAVVKEAETVKDGEAAPATAEKNTD